MGMQEGGSRSWVSQVAQNNGSVAFESNRLTSTDGRAFKVFIEILVCGLKYPLQIEPCMSATRPEIIICFWERVAVVRTNFLAVIATKNPTTQQWTKFFRNSRTVFNGQV